MIDPRQATRDRSEATGEVLKGMGSALGIDSRGFAFSEAVVDPPYDLETLCLLLEHSNALRPNVDAYATNIDGFGHKLQAAIDFDAEDALRGAVVRFAESVRAVEALAAAEGIDLVEADAPTLTGLWQKATGG